VNRWQEQGAVCFRAQHQLPMGAALHFDRLRESLPRLKLAAQDLTAVEPLLMTGLDYFLLRAVWLNWLQRLR
jgi:hypothetical protein